MRAADSAPTAAPRARVGGADEHLRQGHPHRRRRCTSSSTSATTSRPTRSSPTECVAHWLADSVEILIDPRGNAVAGRSRTRPTRSSSGSSRSRTTRPASNGNGVNGPCWSRDADNHQGYSTGPLAATVDDAPNAPGVQVESTATWVGSNSTTRQPRLRGWRLQPRGQDPDRRPPGRDRPGQHGPEHHALRQRQHRGRGLDDAASHRPEHRLAWSTFGGVQSEPYRWGRATLPGYTPPAGQPTTPPAPNVSHPNLDGDRLAADDRPVGAQRRADLRPRARAGGTRDHGRRRGPGDGVADGRHHAAGPAPRACSCTTGEKGYTPVFNTSCAPATNPAPDYGLSAARRPTGRPGLGAGHERARGRATCARRSRRRQADDHDPARRGRRRSKIARAARRWCRSRRRTTRSRRSTCRSARVDRRRRRHGAGDALAHARRSGAVRRRSCRASRRTTSRRPTRP